MRLIISVIISISLLTSACNSTKDMASSSDQAPNTLSAKEMKDGWQLLFDGKTMDEWKGWKKTAPGDKWKVVDGMIVFNPEIEGTAGDIITKEEYEDFEFSLEWKISDCGNSGIMFNIVEDEKYVYPWLTGPEMQILDNKCHPDSKIVTHRAGDLYDMIEADASTFLGANTWHRIMIRSKDGKKEFWQNGKKVVEFAMHTPEWDAMVDDSKFKDMPDFGKARSGHIGLQDHHDLVHFRNIKIREL